MVTLQDVARHAGVSVMTVSNVVNDHPHVRPTTRRRVEQALAELGYRPNMAARNLKRGRTGIIALVLPHLDNPYFAALAHNLIQAAGTRDLTVLIEETGGTAAGERASIQVLHGRLVDGMIFSSEALEADDIAGGPLPTVLLGERTSAALRADHVAVDNVTAAADAVGHLLAEGRRELVLIGDQPGRHGPSGPRLQGALQSMTDAGLSRGPHTVRTVAEYTREDAYRSLGALLDEGVPVDGVFCFNDILAHGALAALHDRGRRVPDEVAVVGFDDLHESRWAIPPLSSVAPDHRVLAEETIDRLVAAVRRTREPSDHEPAGTDVVVPHHLMVRESSRAGAGRG